MKFPFALLSLILVSVLFTQLPLAKASPSTMLSASPRYIVNPALIPSSVFRINIAVADVQNLWGYQFVLSYDTNVLTARDYGLFIPFENFSPSEIDDAAGYVSLAAYTYMGDYSGLTTTEPEPICWIEFVVDSIGESVLHLSNSIFSDPYGNAIPHSREDGYFSNEPPPLPEFAAPSEALAIALSLGIVFVWLRKRNKNSTGARWVCN